MFNYFFGNQSQTPHQQKTDNLDKEFNEEKSSSPSIQIRSYNHRKYPRPPTYDDRLMEDMLGSQKRSTIQPQKIVQSDPTGKGQQKVIIPLPNYPHKSHGNQNLKSSNQKSFQMMQLEKMITERSRFINWQRQLPNNFLVNNKIAEPSISSKFSQSSWNYDPNFSPLFIPNSNLTTAHNLQTDTNSNKNYEPGHSSSSPQVHHLNIFNPRVIAPIQIDEYRCYCHATQCKGKKCGCFVKGKQCTERCQCIHEDCKNMLKHGCKKNNRNESSEIIASPSQKQQNDEESSESSLDINPNFTKPDFSKFF